MIFSCSVENILYAHNVCSVEWSIGLVQRNGKEQSLMLYFIISRVQRKTMLFSTLSTPPVHITMVQCCFEVNGIPEKVLVTNEV